MGERGILAGMVLCQLDPWSRDLAVLELERPSFLPKEKGIRNAKQTAEAAAEASTTVGAGVGISVGAAVGASGREESENSSRS